MTTAAERPTAEIIPFPSRGTRIVGTRPARVDPKLQAELGRYADLASGGGWYHEEALRDPTTPKTN